MLDAIKVVLPHSQQLKTLSNVAKQGDFIVLVFK